MDPIWLYLREIQMMREIQLRNQKKIMVDSMLRELLAMHREVPMSTEMETIAVVSFATAHTIC
jgi:hypothetical protein